MSQLRQLYTCPQPGQKRSSESRALLPPGRHLKEAKNAYDREHKLHTFSVGLRGSPDLVAARRVAKFLGTIHHEFTFTVEEGLDALEDLIWHLESVEQARVLLRGALWPD